MQENITGAIATIIGGACLASILERFGISEMVILIYAILLLLDFLFGVLDAYMLNRKTVTSDTALKGIIRKMIRLSLPFLVVLIFRGAGLEDTKLITDSILSILVLTEGYSIIGHIMSIDHGKQLPEIDAFEMLCKWIAKILKKGIDEKNKDEEKEE